MQKMNWKRYTLTPLRLAGLSLLGSAQFFLVMFGCVYVAKVFSESWPWCSSLKRLAPVIGLASLVYPIYIVIMLEKPKLPARAARKESSNN